MPFITVAGENQIANKQGNNLVLDITHFVLANIAGLGAEPVDRIEALPAAGDIVATRTVTRHGYVNSNQVVYSLVMDSLLGDFDFNWVGLKDADGILIACMHLANPIQKRKTAGAIAGNNLTRNFLIAYSGIQATTAIDVPAETWQIDFNARLWGIDERERLSNFDIYGHEAFFGSGWSVERVDLTTTYNVMPGIAYVGGIRVESTAIQQITVPFPPKSIWLDVSLQGDISDVSAVYSIIIDANNRVDYTDNLGFKHYVTKIANIGNNGSVTDMRISVNQYLLESNIVSQPEAEAGVLHIARVWTALRVRQAINAVVKAATETIAGIAEVATQAETNAGADDTRMVTPKKLKVGFTMLLAVNGYIIAPQWFGSWIIQWGTYTATTTSGTISFNVAYPNACLFRFSVNTNEPITTPTVSPVIVTAHGPLSATSFSWSATNCVLNALSMPGTFGWFSVGY